MEDLQRVQDLVPLRHLSLNRRVCGLRRCVRAGYSDEQFPFQEMMFLDSWGVFSSKD